VLKSPGQLRPLIASLPIANGFGNEQVKQA
jgi:hypothetical protein